MLLGNPCDRAYRKHVRWLPYGSQPERRLCTWKVSQFSPNRRVVRLQIFSGQMPVSVLIRTRLEHLLGDLDR